MLKGIDISGYQKSEVMKDYLSNGFVIIKASEGINKMDSLDTHYNYLHGAKDGKPDTKRLYGFYHYARPEYNKGTEGAKKEADVFISLVGHHAGHCIYALDWEGTALNYDVNWAKVWLDRVYEKTGVKPLIYIQASETSLVKYNSIIKADYGLWIAHWGVNKPSIGLWPFYAMWQYSSGNNLDKDYFNGDKETFKKYCASTKSNKTDTATNSKTGIKVGDKVKLAYSTFTVSAIDELTNRIKLKEIGVYVTTDKIIK